MLKPTLVVLALLAALSLCSAADVGLGHKDRSVHYKNMVRWFDEVRKNDSELVELDNGARKQENGAVGGKRGRK